MLGKMVVHCMDFRLLFQVAKLKVMGGKHGDGMRTRELPHRLSRAGNPVPGIGPFEYLVNQGQDRLPCTVVLHDAANPQ